MVVQVREGTRRLRVGAAVGQKRCSKAVIHKDRRMASEEFLFKQMTGTFGFAFLNYYKWSIVQGHRRMC